MKKILYLSLLSLATPLFLACDSQKNTTSPPESSLSTTTTNEQTAPETSPMSETTPETAMADQTHSVPAYTSDADFVAQAAQSGMAEVKLGNLAERKAIDPEVKKFAIKMVEEHTRANALLINLAREKKWYTPEQMNAEHQAVYNNLMAVMSDEFDRLYMEQMVKDHEMAVALFQQGAAKAKDPELKTYINSTLPALQEHLEMARNLHTKTVAKK